MEKKQDNKECMKALKDFAVDITKEVVETVESDKFSVTFNDITRLMAKFGNVVEKCSIEFGEEEKEKRKKEEKKKEEKKRSIFQRD